MIKIPVVDIAEIMRSCMQEARNIDYDVFCDIMYNGKRDYNTRDSWERMQRNFAKWFCYLDSGNAGKFVRYIVRK